MSQPIYMDHHATAPIDRRVLEVMMPYLEGDFGNASSRVHAYGKKANDAVERARAQLASLIAASPEEIIFTSGATEADNLALKGAVQAVPGERAHIITLRTEHKAVLDSCKALQSQGVRVTYLDVAEDGLVELERLERAIEEDTLLISAMLANNEVGTVQDLGAIGALARKHGVLFHCDAAQGLGYLPFDVEAMGIDMASLSAHKMYGPKGVGALFVRRSLQSRGIPATQIHGGGHEQGFRSGTLNVPGVAGFGAAAALMEREGRDEAERIGGLRDALQARLLEQIPEIRINGSVAHRHPGNLNLSFGYVDGAQLLLRLCERVAVSSGAACSSATEGPSYVLKALGVPKDWAAASIRFGLGRMSTQSHVETAASAAAEVVAGLRARSPQWALHQAGVEVDW